jgi:regulator of protease activity HflC (stomatin/prohibitin superfamily)
MAQIKRYPFFSLLRSEASSHIIQYRKGRQKRSGRGLAFWFDPNGTSISEIPLADRELTFLVKGQSSDFQDLSVQGVVLWRVCDAARLGDRVDFAIDLRSGQPIAKPMDQIASMLTSMVREYADGYLKRLGVREVLEAGLQPLQTELNARFRGDGTLAETGLELIVVRVSALQPTSELARALQMPTFESLQQKADEASFSRRALAVDKERAIAENELANKVELETRRRDLIARQSENSRSEAEAEAAALRIRAEGDAAAKVVAAEAEASRVRAVEQARADMEKALMVALGDAAPDKLFALAARDFAAKLQKIDSITLTPDMLSGLLSQFREGTTRGSSAKT